MLDIKVVSDDGGFPRIVAAPDFAETATPPSIPQAISKNLVSGYLPVFEEGDERRKVAIGVLLYDLRPGGEWVLTYCHTAKLFPPTQGETQVSIYAEWDHENNAFESVYKHIEKLREDIRKQCKRQYETLKSYADGDILDAYQLIINDLKKAQTDDFTLDIYVPAPACPLYGERLYRPGNVGYHPYYMAFNNPLVTQDFDCRDVARRLHAILTEDFPSKGLKTHYDLYTAMTKADRKKPGLSAGS